MRRENWDVPSIKVQENLYHHYPTYTRLLSQFSIKLNLFFLTFFELLDSSRRGDVWERFSIPDGVSAFFQ